MVRQTLDNSPKISPIIFVSSLIVVAMTPWLNVDSLIIPKLILLFALGMHCVPMVFTRYSSGNKTVKMIFIVSLAFLTQTFISLVVSSAPLEQQIYGRSGRGLGFLTYFSVVLIMLFMALYSRKSHTANIQLGLMISGILSSVYSIMQFYGLDIFEWTTRTNGIIGTIGNPNFQSAFTSSVILPSVAFLIRSGIGKVLVIPVSILFLFTIYITNSTQGYVILIASLFILLLYYSFFKKKLNFYILLSIFLIFIILAIFGMLNRGPLAYYLFKVSVSSRGEFWRTAVNTIQDNPIFGVGIDSFGDYSQYYKDLSTIKGINEYTDNSHNYFLEFAVNGGIPLTVFYICILILPLVSLWLIQKDDLKPNFNLISIFVFWVGLNLQSLINPGSISLILWIFIITGFFVGIQADRSRNKIEKIERNSLSKSIDYFKPLSYLFIIISVIITFPLYKADHEMSKAFKIGDADLAVKAAKLFPESTVRYNKVGQELTASQLWPQALDIGRSASNFNNKSVTAWLIILANQTAPLDERKYAKERILELDPFNDEIRKLTIE